MTNGCHVATRVVRYFLGGLSLAASSVFAIASDGIVVIPGESAAYLYNPVGNELIEEISLRLVKEGGFTSYRIESEPSGFLCDESCEETVQRLPAGEVSLKIIGDKPFPLMRIPLTGIWKEGCEALGDERPVCKMNLNETNALVKVEVDPLVKPGTIMPMPGGEFEVMFITADTSRGYAVLALHQALSGGLTWLENFNSNKYSNLGIRSLTDGSANSAKLLGYGSNAAQYCADISQNLAGGWHVPARGELAPITTEALDKIPGLKKDSYIWTSTEYDFYKRDNNIVLKADALRNSSANISSGEYVYVYKLQKDGTWKEDTKYTNKYQVLCVSQWPL